VSNKLVFIFLCNQKAVLKWQNQKDVDLEATQGCWFD